MYLRINDDACHHGRAFIPRESHSVSTYVERETITSYPRLVAVPVVVNTPRRVVYTQPHAHRYIITDGYGY